MHVPCTGRTRREVALHTRTLAHEPSSLDLDPLTFEEEPGILHGRIFIQLRIRLDQGSVPRLKN